jgi:hypothetical protein
MLGLQRTRLGVVVGADRLTVAAIRGATIQTFEVTSENLATALRAELDARGIRRRSVAVGLGRTAVSVKPVELPAVDSDLGEMVRFELERHLAFPAETAVFDFTVLPEPRRREDWATGGKRVLVAAAARHLVDGALRLVRDAGLRPASVTVAAHDLVALVKPPARLRVVWAHRADGTTELVFLDGPTLVLSRSLPSTDDEIVAEEIRRSLGVTQWRRCDAVWTSGTKDPAAPGSTALASLGAVVSAPPYTRQARRWLSALEAGVGAF